MRDRFENFGSRARDHLANERTFLAWVRTALGTIGLGLALDKFLVEDGESQLPGLAFILMGTFFLLHATWRYYVLGRDLAPAASP